MAEQHHFRRPAGGGTVPAAPTAPLPAKVATTATVEAKPAAKSVELIKRLSLVPVKTLEAM